MVRIDLNHGVIAVIEADPEPVSVGIAEARLMLTRFESDLAESFCGREYLVAGLIGGDVIDHEDVRRWCSGADP
jgi:hypothetical protein